MISAIKVLLYKPRTLCDVEVIFNASDSSKVDSPGTDDKVTCVQYRNLSLCPRTQYVRPL